MIAITTSNSIRVKARCRWARMGRYLVGSRESLGETRRFVVELGERSPTARDAPQGGTSPDHRGGDGGGRGGDSHAVGEWSHIRLIRRRSVSPTDVRSRQGRATPATPVPGQRDGAVPARPR